MVQVTAKEWLWLGVLGALSAGCTRAGNPLRGGDWNPDTGSQLASADDLAATQTLIFSQAVDHNDTSAGTFGQHYLRNSTYADGPSSPVLLLVCGEGPCTANAMNVYLKTNAARYHAHMVALEHRYYGTSFPVADLSPQNLQYLSADQALADLASFIGEMQKEGGLTGPWIAIGGSYSGALAAYLRALHPELVAGALASSAPVEAKEAFDAYDRVVGQALGDTCAAATRALVAQVDNPFTLSQVASELGLSPASAASTVGSTLESLAGAAAQYAFKKDEYCNAVESSDPAGQLAIYSQDVNAAFQGFGGDVTSTAIPPANTAGGRMWYWQTCTQFGFFQVALPDRSLSVFSQSLNLQLYENSCEQLFGLGGPDVDTTNRDLYDRVIDSGTTRILFTNGTDDPWSALSLTQDPADGAARDIHTYSIAGGSHASDLLAPADGDSASLQGARAEFQSLLDKWLAPATTAPAYGKDVFLALGPDDTGASVTLYAAGDARIADLALCSGDLATCVAAPVRSLRFAKEAPPAGGPLATRALFMGQQPFPLTGGTRVTVLGWDANGALIEAQELEFNAAS